MFFLQQFINGIMYGSVYSLIGIGLTLIFGALNIINLAHGEVIISSAFVCITLYVYAKLNFLLASFLAIISGIIIGLFIEIITIRPLRKSFHLAPFISTIGASIFISEALTNIFTSEATYFENPFEYSEVDLGGVGFRIPYLITFGIALVCIIFLQYFIKKTKTGLAIRCVAENITVSNLMGIDVSKITSITIAIASAIGAVGGLLMAISSSVIYPAMGGEALFKGLVVILLGGLGNIQGAVIGGLILGVVEFLCTAFISSSYRDAFAFGVLFLILILKPTGLLGKSIK